MTSFCLQNLSLVLRSETGDGNAETYPQAYYIVMASSNSTLLVKSIVMDELMLPSDFPTLADKTSQQSTEVIEDCLERVGFAKFVIAQLAVVYLPYHTILRHATPRHAQHNYFTTQLLTFQLPIQEVYNPFFMKSNLYKFFISKTLKNNPGSRAGKRKIQAPQV